MERKWWWKTGLIAVLVILSVLYLIPTIFGEDNVPDWYSDFFDSRLNLGLDLQGGIHLVLGVEVEKAVVDYVDRLTEEVNRHCDDEDLDCAKVRSIEGKPRLVVEFETEKQLEDARQSLEEFLGNMNVIDEDPGAEFAMFFEIKEDFAERRKKSAVSQAIETLRNRIDEMAVREALVAKQGDTSILIQIPGIEDVERARKMIGQTAQLEFKIVDESYKALSKFEDQLPEGWEMHWDSQKDKNSQIRRSPYISAVKDVEGKNLATIKEWLKGKIDSEHVILFEEFEDQNKNQTKVRSYNLYRKVMLTGDTITDARVSIDQQKNRPYVSMNFDRQGAKIFGQVTGDHVHDRMAIVLDNHIRSAPSIQSKISGGRAMITLNSLKSYNELLKEAEDLSIVLRAGALPAPVRFEETRTVGPTLGQDSIESGQLSLMVGFLLVIIFMVIYYRSSGLIADGALLLNMLFIMAIMAGFGATLTLPGMAGIVLTIGMAVDANVIIYERIREELRIGKTAKAAIEAGYGRAFWTIFDANITTVLAGFVLWSYGTGPVKGFAVTLIIGIICSMFTALFCTRQAFDYITSRFKPETLKI